MTLRNLLRRPRCVQASSRGLHTPSEVRRFITINYRSSGNAFKKHNDHMEEVDCIAADPGRHTQPPSIYPATTTSRKSSLPSPLHNSLTSFLAYASQTNLSSASTVFLGTKYEYTCLEALRSLGLNLTRVGGANDAGIDLEGSWLLPTLTRPLPALVQCKFLTQKSISPVLVRELEGAFSASPETDTQPVVGILCTPGLATKAVRETLRRCTRPVVLASIDEEGWIDAVVWNNAVKNVCEGVSIGVKYVGKRKAAFLLVGDQPWRPDNEDGDLSNG